MSNIDIQPAPDRAELTRQVHFCIERARDAVLLSIDPERRDLVTAFASALLSTLRDDPFRTAEDIARWTADQLERAIDERDACRGQLPNAQICTRLTFVVELTKWLFPTFGRLPTFRDEIARLRHWRQPFTGGGDAKEKRS